MLDEPLKVSFQSYLGSEGIYGNTKTYDNFLPAENIKITTNVENDTSDIQWMIPLRNDGSYEEQTKRLLQFLQITKFGMIAL